MSCLIVLVFALASCESNEEDSIGIENSITNMSQLPIDLTKLKSNAKSNKVNPVFLSTTVEPNVEEFEVIIDDFSVSTIDSDFYFDHTDERGAHIFNSVNQNSTLKTTEIDGGVQVLYTMPNASSPNEFALELNLSEGSNLIADDNKQYYVVSSD
jgi:hypothetical protein